MLISWDSDHRTLIHSGETGGQCHCPGQLSTGEDPRDSMVRATGQQVLDRNQPLLRSSRSGREWVFGPNLLVGIWEGFPSAVWQVIEVSFARCNRVVMCLALLLAVGLMVVVVWSSWQQNHQVRHSFYILLYSHRREVKTCQECLCTLIWQGLNLDSTCFNTFDVVSHGFIWFHSRLLRAELVYSAHEEDYCDEPLAEMLRCDSGRSGSRCV